MPDSLPLSLLNDYLYCPRRAALKAIEGWWGENEHTVLGSLAHEHADLPGYEVARGVTLLRALPVWSERLGLSGKCDIVERHADSSLVPVEYKKGRRRTFENETHSFVRRRFAWRRCSAAQCGKALCFMRRASAAGKWNSIPLCEALPNKPSPIFMRLLILQPCRRPYSSPPARNARSTRCVCPRQHVPKVAPIA